MVAETKIKKRKVLVTGSSGMLGKDLCQELSIDRAVDGLDARPSDGQAGGPERYFESDITDRKAVIEHIAASEPEVIVHAAAWTDVDGCERDHDKAARVNIQGTENVVEAARKLGAAVVFISTDYVFDGQKKGLYTEKDTPKPLSFYGLTKLEGEKAVSALPDHVVVRTSWLYGANGKNFVDTIMAKAKKVKRLEVVNDQAGSPTYTKDLARAIHVMLNKIPLKGQKIYHACNKGVVTWFDYSRYIVEYAGIEEVDIIPITSQKLNSPAVRPASSGMDTSLLWRDTAFAFRPWQDALKEYINEHERI